MFSSLILDEVIDELEALDIGALMLQVAGPELPIASLYFNRLAQKWLGLFPSSMHHIGPEQMIYGGLGNSASKQVWSCLRQGRSAHAELFRAKGLTNRAPALLIPIDMPGSIGRVLVLQLSEGRDSNPEPEVLNSQTNPLSVIESETSNEPEYCEVIPWERA